MPVQQTCARDDATAARSARIEKPSSTLSSACADETRNPSISPISPVSSISPISPTSPQSSGRLDRAHACSPPSLPSAPAGLLPPTPGPASKGAHAPRTTTGGSYGGYDGRESEVSVPIDLDYLETDELVSGSPALGQMYRQILLSCYIACCERLRRPHTHELTHECPRQPTRMHAPAAPPVRAPRCMACLLSVCLSHPRVAPISDLFLSGLLPMVVFSLMHPYVYPGDAY